MAMNDRRITLVVLALGHRTTSIACGLEHLPGNCSAFEDALGIVNHNTIAR